MSLRVTLGPARLDEVHRLAQLSRDQVEQGLGWSYTPPALARAMSRPDKELVVARNDTGPCGFGLMRFGNLRAHLHLLAVAPECRRHGVGTAVMDWLEVMAKTAGIFDIDLEVRIDNATAQAFYRQRGYEPVCRLTGFYDRREDALLMRTDLRVRV